MEMTRLWKSQTDFHSRLEISHTTRDSHIPTADHRCFRFEERRMNRPSSGSLSDRPTGLVSERRAQWETLEPMDTNYPFAVQQGSAGIQLPASQTGEVPVP